ncbi:hypothetical protein [Enterococcus sp. DIV0756]|uniref:hypothetical protein n=1 Tax=Enterococcus sp. DIV0756 TaxID=2774636 RepID=UPI003F22167F
MINKKKTVMSDGKSVDKKIEKRLAKFIEKKKESIVYRGVTNEYGSVEFTTLISDVGEKGKYFKQTLLNEGIEYFEKLNINEDSMNDFDIKSHANSSPKLSKYVSTTKEFEVAKEFALMKKNEMQNSYIILAYYDRENDKGQFKVLTQTYTQHASEKETTFFHAIFADRIIGVFSLDESGEFTIFNINPNLHQRLIKKVPNSFEVDQTKFDQHKELLGYKHETWKMN